MHEDSFTPKRHITDDWKTWKYFVFGICTCGIYQYWVFWNWSKDVNEMCPGDGEGDLAGVVEFILLTLVTCGIYAYYWHWKLLKKVEKKERELGVAVVTLSDMELPTIWLILEIAGMVLSCCGLGVVLVLYALYLEIQNIDALASEYNRINGV